jgi:hypothetical protein
VRASPTVILGGMLAAAGIVLLGLRILARRVA